MYRSIVFCCALLIGALACFAQGKKTSVNNKSLLWKISGNGLKKPSYLFGTLHIICPSDYLWTPAMQKALDQSSRVAFEMDMDDPTLQAQMTAGMTLKDGKKLKDFYTEAEYKKLTELSAKNGIPLQLMQNFNPFALVSFLYLKAVACAIPDSYEDKIRKQVQQDDKEIIGLESVNEQVDVIKSMNTDTIAKSVLRIAEDLDSFKTTFNQILAVYKKQDLPALYQLIIESPDYKNDLNTLLFDRNLKWAPVIADLAKEQSTFFAVGAAHLWGDRGVIDLLRKEGYTVEPVR